MNSISLIKKVVHSIETLSDVIRGVKVNRKRCHELGQKIEHIGETLKPLQEPTFVNENMELTLYSFCNFIDECTHFVRKFFDLSLYKRLSDHGAYEDEFERYDNELSNYSNKIQLNIEIAIIDNVKKLSDTTRETQKALNAYKREFHEKIDELAETQSTNTKNLTNLSDRMDMTNTSLNELREDVSNLAKILHEYGLQLKQNIGAQQQILTQIADKNKTHSDIYRRAKN